jgi:hypothetical protein
MVYFFHLLRGRKRAEGRRAGHVRRHDWGRVPIPIRRRETRFRPSDSFLLRRIVLDAFFARAL